MNRLVASCGLALGLSLLAPTQAEAFCGFYVAGADAELFNDATVVVLMRDGTRTVLSMQNDYQGPPEQFALVIPVPVVLQEGDVKTLRPELFDRVETLSAPRLVEYWEMDPCGEGQIGLGNTGQIGLGTLGGAGSGYGSRSYESVSVEAQFVVGEYDIVILSASESSELDGWLRDNDYAIPEGAEPLLQPYVQQGMKFFVAKVDPKKVKFDEQGRTKLSPLRFHYDSKDFVLPVRLGLINAPDPSTGGKQDLLVHILAPDTRHEVVNHPNVTIPTNLDLQAGAKEKFGEFYVSLFDHTLEQNPGAVVTEYAWSVASCDPCPNPEAELTGQELLELGADVLPGTVTASPRITPMVRQDKHAVSGDLDKDIVRRIVRAHINEVRSCYHRGLLAAPTLAGRVTIDFTIAKTGKVASATVADSTLADATVAECIAKAANTWIFPKPGDGKRVDVSYPFVLDPGDPTPRVDISADFVLTRLHARYDAASLGEDLVFAAAPPLGGGRELRDEHGKLEQDPVVGEDFNNFQARYAIRHEWTGAIECDEVVRGIWGDPPAQLMVAKQLTEVARGASLAGFVDAQTLDRLGVVPEPAEPDTGVERTTSPAAACTCSSTRESPVSVAPLALLALFGLRRGRGDGSRGA